MTHLANQLCKQAKKLCSILAITACCAQSATAEQYTSSTIAVIDNSGLVAYPDEENAKGLTPYDITIRLFVSNYLKTFGKDVHLTVISVARSEIIWEGDAQKASGRNNHAMVNLITAEPGGCADFEQVATSINRARRGLTAPLKEVIFLTPLVHTGAHPCALDRDNLAPPPVFFELLGTLQEETGAALTFFWTHDKVLDALDAHLHEKGIPFVTKNEHQTRAIVQ
jgi:hypothetical protein